jgi:hypothetical protein
MKAALKRGVETGALVQLKNSYKVSPEAKKELKVKKPASTEAKAKAKKVRQYITLECHGFAFLVASLTPFILNMNFVRLQTTVTKKPASTKAKAKKV